MAPVRYRTADVDGFNIFYRHVSLEMEIEGCWPRQRAAKARSTADR
jgi:hypothetical protein